MKTCTASLRAAAALVCSFALPALGVRTINVNVAAGGTGNTAIDGEETFGVAALGTVGGHWANIKWNLDNLPWNDGTDSTVNLTANFFESALNYYGPGYINTPFNYGPAHYTGTSDDPGTGFTFTNLTANFPDGYYVIVFMSGFTTNTGALVSDGRTTYYYVPPADNKTVLTPDMLVQATQTTDPGAGNYQPAHYAVFGSKDSPMRFSSFTVRVDVISGGGAAICGAQIVSAGPDVVVKTDWAGFPIMDGWVNTGSFLGWLWVGADGMGLENWVYSEAAGQWIFCPESYATAGSGGWFYLADSAALSPTGIAGQWFYAGALGTWAASFGDTVGSGPAWIYAFDLNPAG